MSTRALTVNEGCSTDKDRSRSVKKEPCTMEDRTTSSEALARTSDNCCQLDFDVSMSQLEWMSDSPKKHRSPSLTHSSTPQLNAGLLKSPRRRSVTSMQANHDSLPQLCQGVSSCGSFLRSNFKAQTKGSSSAVWQLPQSNSSDTPEWMKRLKNKGEKDDTDVVRIHRHNSLPEPIKRDRSKSDGSNGESTESVPEWKKKFLEMKSSSKLNFPDNSSNEKANDIVGECVPDYPSSKEKDSRRLGLIGIERNDVPSIPPWKSSIFKSRQMQAELLYLGRQANEDQQESGSKSMPGSMLHRLHSERGAREKQSMSPGKPEGDVPEWMRKFQAMNFEKDEKVIEAGGKQDPGVMTNGNGVVVNWVRTVKASHLEDKAPTERSEKPSPHPYSVGMGDTARSSSSTSSCPVVAVGSRQNSQTTEEEHDTKAAIPIIDRKSSRSSFIASIASETTIPSLTTTVSSNEPGGACEMPSNVHEYPDSEERHETVKTKKKKRNKDGANVAVDAKGDHSRMFERAANRLHEGYVEASPPKSDETQIESFSSPETEPLADNLTNTTKGIRKKKKGHVDCKGEAEVDVMESSAETDKLESSLQKEQRKVPMELQTRMHESFSSLVSEQGPSATQQKKKNEKKVRGGNDGAGVSAVKTSMQHDFPATSSPEKQGVSSMNESFSSRDSSDDLCSSLKVKKSKKKKVREAVQFCNMDERQSATELPGVAMHESFSSRDSSGGPNGAPTRGKKKKKKKAMSLTEPNDHRERDLLARVANATVAPTQSMHSHPQEPPNSGGESNVDDFSSRGAMSSSQADETQCESKSSSSATIKSNDDPCSPSTARRKRLEEREQIAKTLKAFLEHSKSRIAERNQRSQEASMLPRTNDRRECTDVESGSSGKNRRHQTRVSRSRTSSGTRENHHGERVRQTCHPRSPRRKSTGKRHASRRSSAKKSDPPASNDAGDEDVFRVVSRNESFQMSVQRISLPMDFDEFDEDADEFSLHDHVVSEAPATDAVVDEDAFETHFSGSFEEDDARNSNEDPFGFSGPVELDETEFSEDPFGITGAFGDSFETSNTDCQKDFDSGTHVTDSTWDFAGDSLERLSGRRRSLEHVPFSRDDRRKGGRTVERTESLKSQSRRKSTSLIGDSQPALKKPSTKRSSQGASRRS